MVYGSWVSLELYRGSFVYGGWVSLVDILRELCLLWLGVFEVCTEGALFMVAGCLWSIH